MSGWRDNEGRTRADRRKVEGEAERARFVETAKHRPLTLLRNAGLVLFALLIAGALVLQLG